MIGMSVGIYLHHPGLTVDAEELEIDGIAIKDQGLNNDLGSQKLIVSLPLLSVEIHREPGKNLSPVNRFAIASDDHVTARVRGLDTAR